MIDGVKADEAPPRNIDHSPIPPILSGVEAALDGSVRWGIALVWFMRVIAAVWILKGLIGWGIILGVNGEDFLALQPGTASAIAFFAVADLVAAVGLWLAAPWGGVLWLLCAATEVIAPMFGVVLGANAPVTMAVDGALIVAYFALGWLAASET